MLYQEMIEFANLQKAYHVIRSHTKHRRKIARFELYYMMNLLQIYEVLKSKQYAHSTYHIFLIRIPRYRIVMSENISDKIVNYLISEYALLPAIEPVLVPFNVATRKNMGVKKGIYYVKKYVNYLKEKYDNFYILKCDVRKYFYNINHERLIEKLEKVIFDPDILAIIRNIIFSTNHSEINQKLDFVLEQERERLRKMNGADLFQKLNDIALIPYYKEGRGLPIGNMTSQIFAVFYLNDLDHFIKEKLHIKYYVRYMDDFLLFHPDKEYLKYCLMEIEKKVKEEKLELNQKTKIYSMKEGFPFMGYRFLLKGKRLILRLNPQTKRRIKKNLDKLQKSKHPKYENVKASYYGYLNVGHCGSFLQRHGWYEKKKDLQNE